MSTQQISGEGKLAFLPNLKFLLIGILFGILLLKAEVINWYRIQEMFRFQSFHMYGIIGSAVIVGVVAVYLMKRWNVKSLGGEPVVIGRKQFNKGQVYGGLLFGFGWALTGACPGPIFAQIGTGTSAILITLASAIVGTWTYGYFREKLPH